MAVSQPMLQQERSRCHYTPLANWTQEPIATALHRLVQYCTGPMNQPQWFTLRN